MIDILNNIIGKRVKRLFLIVWPPICGSDASQIDISVGFVFEDSTNELFKISTDRNDLETPLLEHLPVPTQYFGWESFGVRMDDWMLGKEGMEFDIEYYEVTEANIFQNIVNKKVLDVELVGITNQSPLGLKFIFENDFILSSPIADGNTIETGFFNKNQNLKHFKILGKIEFISLKTGTITGIE